MEKGFGTSDGIIGRWLKRSGHRDDIVLATKAYQPMGLDPNDRRLSVYLEWSGSDSCLTSGCCLTVAPVAS
jgi:aryl-alcohol dehydrogenase-like predicted oxidoreductase